MSDAWVYDFGDKEYLCKMNEDYALGSDGQIVQNAEIISALISLMVSISISNYRNDGGIMKTIHVVAAIIRDGNKIFATQRGYGAYKDFWEFPGGKIEVGETPQEALVREIKEELDTEIDVGDLLTTIEYDYPEFHLSMLCFWCKILDGKPVLMEHEAARWLDPENMGSVSWLPADMSIISMIREIMIDQVAEEVLHKRTFKDLENR